MALFGKKDKQVQESLQSEPPPTISEADLVAASRLMDRWDSSYGNSEATWDCIEQVARQGGFKGSQASMMEVSRGKSASDVTQRPWRWWIEATRLAQAAGNDVLVGRIFVFTFIFVSELAPKMRVVDQMETGLDRPHEDTYKSIAALAVSSLACLSPELVVSSFANGEVDVATALGVAEEASGITAPHVDPGTQAPSDDSGPFNSL